MRKVRSQGNHLVRKMGRNKGRRKTGKKMKEKDKE